VTARPTRNSVVAAPRSWLSLVAARRIGIAVAAIVGLLIAAVVAAVTIALRKGDEAAAQKQVATSRALAAAALANSDGSPELAMLLALEAYSRVHDEGAAESYEARNSLLTTVERAARLKSVLYGLPARAREIAFAPDGRTLAVAGEDGWIRFWNAATGMPVGKPVRARSPMRFSRDSATLVASTDEGVTVFDVAERVPRAPALDVVAFIDVDDDGVADQNETDDTSVSLSSDAQFAVATGMHGVFTVWDLVLGAPVVDLGISDPLAGGAWSLSPDNRFFAVTDAGQVRLFDLLAGKQLGRLPQRHVANVEFGPDRTLALGTRTGIELWDVVRGASAGDPLHTAKGAGGPLAFSPDGQKLAFTGTDGRARIWNIGRGRSGVRLIRDVGGVRSFSFSPDGATLAVGTDDGTTFVDVAGRAPLVNPIGISGQDPLEDAAFAFSPNGHAVASAAADGTIRIWDLERRVPFQRRMLQRTDPDSGVTVTASELAFTASGRSLVVNGDDGVVVWNLAESPASARHLFVPSPFSLGSHMAVSRDGRVLAFTGDDATTQIWDLVRDKTLAVLPTDAESLSFSLDGRTLATSSSLTSLNGVAQTPGIRLWDVAHGRPLGKRLPDGGDEIALSPDGEILASGPLFGGKIRLWSVSHRTQLGQLSSGAGVWKLVFSPDGRTLAAAGDDGGVRLWDFSGGAPLGGPPLRGHTNIVESVAFSPDGQTLASASEDGTVRLWDVARGAPLGEALSSSTGSVVKGVAFSPDGRTLASADYDGIRVWGSILLSEDLDTWRERVCGTVRRNLTEDEWHRFLPDESHLKTCPQFD
jgi:WD40 repeat protein